MNRGALQSPIDYTEQLSGVLESQIVGGVEPCPEGRGQAGAVDVFEEKSNDILWTPARVLL